MNFTTNILHILTSSAAAFVTSRNMRDSLTRPSMLAGLQLSESGAVPFLEKLSQRATAEGNTWLAEKLARHAADERRHGQIFAQALKQLNKQVIDFKSLPKSNNNNRSPFFAAYYQGYSSEDLKPENINWDVFMASTYILELDASKDFVRMANALPEDPISNNIKKGILSVAKDETGHAAYLYEALESRLPAAEVVKLTDEWRSRKVNALFAMINDFLQKGGKMNNLARDGVPSELENDLVIN
ncbi:ferritin-like domain-containing protein [Aerosakkonemataceae cyanobacterium BLCC-F50]|uniref:Ferritin-like domain-containing protein n=1 Tax=Floridaenema flaviceps BLCC-F50 TaxID=3153642 RepID=A0ABV4XII6_9CYAN